MLEMLEKYCKNNPGAMTFMMELIKPGTLELNKVAIINNKLERLESIRGTNLYVLWSDLANQDYSGRKLLQEYVGEYKVQLN